MPKYDVGCKIRIVADLVSHIGISHSPVGIGVVLAVEGTVKEVVSRPVGGKPAGLLKPPVPNDEMMYRVKLHNYAEEFIIAERWLSPR